MKITPKNWSEFQHYKNRSPSWIKLHRGLLDNFEFFRLPLASRALAPMLWLLASEYEDGCIDGSEEEIAFRMRISTEDLIAGLKPLIEFGFFTSASVLLADCKQDASLEREEEESKRERREELDIPAGAGADVISIDRGSYVFSGKVIRLKQDQLDKWKISFPAITDIRDELALADEYYAENPPKDGKWFFKTFAWLQRANDQARKRHKEHLRAIGDAW